MRLLILSVTLLIIFAVTGAIASTTVKTKTYNPADSWVTSQKEQMSDEELDAMGREREAELAKDKNLGTVKLALSKKPNEATLSDNAQTENPLLENTGKQSSGNSTEGRIEQLETEVGILKNEVTSVKENDKRQDARLDEIAALQKQLQADLVGIDQRFFGLVSFLKYGNSTVMKFEPIYIGYFAKNSCSFNPNSAVDRGITKAVNAILKIAECTKKKVVVTLLGFADNTGTAAGNQKVGMQRADAILRGITRRINVDNVIYDPKGIGYSDFNYYADNQRSVVIMISEIEIEVKK
jgi:outer membrane protein OmpA-like peptidoglycan-associated protein